MLSLGEEILTDGTGNWTAPSRDNTRVDCDTCREALSARIDGEAEPAAPDEHLHSCPECQEWETAAAALFREFADELPTPDLAAAVLGTVEPRTGLLGATRWRPRRFG